MAQPNERIRLDRERILPPTREEGKNQKTLLSHEDEQQIIRVFNNKEVIEDFSVVVSYDDIAAKNCSLSAGQYFDVKTEHIAITPKQFEKELAGRTAKLTALFGESRAIEKQIAKQLARLSND